MVSMISCPPFAPDLRKLPFIPLLHLMAIGSTIIHFYTMYAIVFRSNAQMKVYRWYLLWHQIVSFFGDFWINSVTQPVVYFPIPIGYLTGLGEGFVHPQMALAIGQFFVVLECITCLHLLLYRYFVVSQVDSFPMWSKLLLTYTYTTPFINFTLTATANSQSEKVLAELKEKYSCVTDSIISIPGIWAYERDEYMKKTLIVLALDMINYSIMLPYFVYATFKAINVKIMSETTRRMQRKFLIQLVLQAGIPMLFVLLPSFILGLAVIFKVFGVIFLNGIVFCCYSLFGVSGAVVLLIMVPSYHGWLNKLKRKDTSTTRKIDVKAASSS